MDQKELTLNLANAVDFWRNSAEGFVKQVIGVGSKKCKCMPFCEVDVLQAKILADLSALYMAKLHVWHERSGYDVEISNEERELARKIGVSVQSAKGIGKTTLLSWAILWFFTLSHGAKGICTAPKRDLLKDNLWPEITKWIDHSKECFGDKALLPQLFETQSDKIFRTGGIPKKDWGKVGFMVTRTARPTASAEEQANTLQGYHEDFMLLAADEASGVADSVFNPLEATLTGPVNMLFIIFNPNKNFGYAIDTQNKFKELWITHRMSALESSLVTKDHIRRLEIKYKGAPNLWRCNVLGLPPLEDDDALIPFYAIMDAVSRETNYDILHDYARCMAVDIGGGGTDSTECCVRQGHKVYDFRTINSGDRASVLRFIEDVADEEQPFRIGIDGIGIGWGVDEDLREHGYKSDFVDVRRRAFDVERYHNLRAELYWKLREFFTQAPADIPDDEELIQQLASLKRDKKGTGDRLKVVGKEAMRSNGLPSPNKADALMLTMFYTFAQAKNHSQKRRDRYDEEDSYGRRVTFMGI